MSVLRQRLPVEIVVSPPSLIDGNESDSDESLVDEGLPTFDIVSVFFFFYLLSVLFLSFPNQRKYLLSFLDEMKSVCIGEDS